MSGGLRRLALSAALLCIGRWAVLRAQSASDPLASAIRSYQNLELDAAAGLLRRALDARGRGSGGGGGGGEAATGDPAEPLSRPERVRAMMYLAATELLRDHRDSAQAIARRLVVFDPRYRPSDLLFPPKVIALIDSSRRATPAVIATAPADTIVRGHEAAVLRLFPSAYHQIRASIARENGTLLRTLYAGPIADSLELHWDGRDSAGALASGDFRLEVTSRDARGRVVRILRLPLAVSWVSPETLPLPPPPPGLLPERQPVGPGLRALAPGAVAGAAIVILPSLVAGHDGGMDGRLAVSGAAIVAGVYALFSHHPGDPLPQNVVRNQVVRARWRTAADSVARINVARLAEVRVRIRSGEPAILSPEEP